MTPALIVVDYQLDFAWEYGALYVPGGEQLEQKIERLSELYSTVVLTQDWHVPNDPSFKDNGGTWPRHCVRGTPGASFLGIPRTQEHANMVLRKPENSAFFMSGGLSTGLDGWLNDRNVKELHLCGLALDYCVRETALDALSLNWSVAIVLDATKAVNLHPTDGERAIDELVRRGAKIL